jgi:hypothetical protein
MFDSIFTGGTDATTTFPQLLAALGVALALGLLISLIYMKTHKTKTPSQSFALTLVLLPTVITVIILLVGNNVAWAFSLAGAFSIIRFRSSPGDPKDITFVLFSMAVGLAAGMGFLLYAVAVGILLCAVMLALDATKFGQAKGTEKKLKITIPENLDYQNAFDGVLQKYALSTKLRKIKTADLGSLYVLTYAIVTKEGINEKDFIDELRCRNGNLTIQLTMDATGDDNF